MVSERTIIKMVALVGLILLGIFAWNTIQNITGPSLPFNANLGILGIFLLAGAWAYLKIRGKVEEIRE
jgi:amino acid transporter